MEKYNIRMARRRDARIKTRISTEQLESMIDTKGLRHILDTLVDICMEKAEHLRSNWQDTTAADNWETAANGLDRVNTEDLP